MAGCARRRKQGFTHAVQVDADGQHDLDDLPNCSRPPRRATPTALICGEPRFDESVPKSRLYGRKLTAFWVAVETLSLQHARHDVRLSRLSARELRSRCSTRSRWAGAWTSTSRSPCASIGATCRWSPVPTAVIYPRRRHVEFPCVADNALITKLHTKLVLRHAAAFADAARTAHRRAACTGPSSASAAACSGMRLLFGTYRLLGRPAFTRAAVSRGGVLLRRRGHARRASRDYLAAVRARLAELGRPDPAAA